MRGTSGGMRGEGVDGCGDRGEAVWGKGCWG